MTRSLRTHKRYVDLFLLEDDWEDSEDLLANDNDLEFLKRGKANFSLEGRHIFYEFED